jgi:hypothetical protein
VNRQKERKEKRKRMTELEREREIRSPTFEMKNKIMSSQKCDVIQNPKKNNSIKKFRTLSGGKKYFFRHEMIFHLKTKQTYKMIF